jgi:hypothetical protein
MYFLTVTSINQRLPIKTILSGTSSSIRTKIWWHSHWMRTIQWLCHPNFDGIVIGWSSSKIVSGSRALPPRCRHSAVALLLKAALIQVSDYRLLGASCLKAFTVSKMEEGWFLCEFPIGSYVKLSTAVQPSWSEGGITRHKFGREPSNDYFIKVWFERLQAPGSLLFKGFYCFQDGRGSIWAQHPKLEILF